MKSVAAAHQINASAASMRLTRLRKALGSHTESSGEDGDGNNAAADVTPQASKTPKPKGNKATPAGAQKANGSDVGNLTPTPAPKGKKRKLSQEEQVNALIQQVKVEARTKMETGEATEG